MVTALDERPASPASLSYAHHALGASTGWLRDAGDWADQVHAAAAVSTYAIELAALAGPEFDGLEQWLHTLPRLPFGYISVHAPVKQLVGDEAALVARLAELPPFVRSIVVHPDVMGDAAAYAQLGARLVIENMDDRKAMGQTAEDLAPLFDALPEAGFCLDVAHVSALDDTMALADDLLDNFGTRLRHLHVSSLVDGSHAPVTREDSERFLPVLRRCIDVPWILEAPRSVRPTVADEVRHEPATGALERLAAAAGTPLPALFAARAFTTERVAHQRAALSTLHMDDDASIVLFGSWGRHELTRSSDGDWLVLVDGDKRDFVDPDPAEVAAALAETAPGREELFGEVAFSTDLREQIGLGQDINKNLTRRMLLVLESIAVAGDRSWESARRGVLESYVGARSRDYAPPRFFLNDLVRYWRTIAVDFEGKDRSRGGSGWGLRSAKLRTSRKLLFASGLLPILECRRLPASEMLQSLSDEFSAPATDRIAAAFLRYDAPDLGARVLTAYDRVIALLDDPDARSELVALIESESDRSALFQDLRRYSDQIQAGLLSLLFDDRRLASVVREYMVF